MSITLKCNDAKINSSYKNEFIIEADVISIEGDIDEILNHFSDSQIAKYKYIDNVVAELKDDDILNNLDEDSIIEYVLNDEKLFKEILNRVDESHIISKARQIKIERIL